MEKMQKYALSVDLLIGTLSLPVPERLSQLTKPATLPF
jgi:hypothetical protein